MDWLLHHWQSIAVGLIVAVTVLLFGCGFVRRTKARGCGRNCGCGVSRKEG